MNSHWLRQYRLAVICAGVLALNGCAMLGLDSSDDNQVNDPVARAALQVRNREPASLPAPSTTDVSARVPRQLTLGMSMPSVRQLWGQPEDIQTAGDPSLENQRWTYYNGLRSDWGTSDTRIVYFEQGRVAGWQSRR